MLIDPVCGKRIKRNRAHVAIDYNGVTYYLCCPRCQADFERAPELFARVRAGEKTRKAYLSRAQANFNQNILISSTRIVRGPAQ